MKSSKVLLWEVNTTPHKNPRFQWARMSPSFEKGWITIVRGGMKAKVQKNATDKDIKAAVVQRLERDGRPTHTPIKITRR